MTRGKGFEAMTMSDTGEGMGGSVDILLAWPLTVSTEKNIDMIICLGGGTRPESDGVVRG